LIKYFIKKASVFRKRTVPTWIYWYCRRRCEINWV